MKGCGWEKKITGRVFNDILGRTKEEEGKKHGCKSILPWLGWGWWEAHRSEELVSCARYYHGQSPHLAAFQGGEMLKHGVLLVSAASSLGMPWGLGWERRTLPLQGSQGCRDRKQRHFQWLGSDRMKALDTWKYRPRKQNPSSVCIICNKAKQIYEHIKETVGEGKHRSF
jgi:hypothetical protein